MSKSNRSRRKRFVAIFMISMLTIALGRGDVQSKASAESAGEYSEIVIGSDDYPPFNYMDENGQPTGIDVELAKEAFGRMGYKVVFRQINWEEKSELLGDGQIDCIWGSFSIDGREEEYQWAGPYMISRQVVAVNEDSDIYALQDLEGKRIAVQATTKPEELFEKHSEKRLPAVKEIFSMQNRELIYPFLSKGYADAVAAHETAILQYMKDYNLKYRILEEPLLTVGLGVAFSKNDKRGIAKKLTDIFGEMRVDGTTQKILGKYLDNVDDYLEVDTYAK